MTIGALAGTWDNAEDTSSAGPAAGAGCTIRKASAAKPIQLVRFMAFSSLRDINRGPRLCYGAEYVRASAKRSGHANWLRSSACRRRTGHAWDEATFANASMRLRCSWDSLPWMNAMNRLVMHRIEDEWQPCFDSAGCE